MKVDNKIPVMRSVFTETISIVIAVLLALAVNDWNEDRVHAERADEAIQNIIKEIDSNIKFMSVVNTNNKTIIELLIDEDSIPDDSALQFVPGLQVQDTAWKTLQSTGVSEYIKYSVLYEISNIYSLQEIYKTLGYQLIQNITNTRVLVTAVTLNKTKTIDNKLFLSDMMLIEQIEKALLESYAETLEKLKSIKSASI